MTLAALFARLVVDRRTPRLVPVLAMLLALPSLGVGLVLDDWFHRSRVFGGGLFPSMDHPLLEYFAMVPREGDYAAILKDMLAWWHAPDLEITFFRPLSVVFHLLDDALWPDVFPLHHLHSVLWYGLAVLAVTWMYRQISSSPAAAVLMALFFAFEDAHGMPVGWIANRNALVTLVFGSLAVGLHARWRLGAGSRYGLAAPAALALGLLGGESAIGAVAYLVAWEACRAPSSPIRRVLALAPSAIVVAAWRLLYVHLGFRTWNSGLYIDPGREPFSFLRAALERASLLLFSQWTQAPIDLFIAFPRPMQVALSFFGVGAVVVLLALFGKTLRQDGEARFWALGMALAVVPICATFPMDRLLTFTGIGAFGLLAVQVRRLGWIGGTAEDRAGRLVRWGTALLVVLHLLLAPALLMARSLSPRFLYGAAEASADLVPSEVPRGEVWVVANGFDLFAMYIPIFRARNGQVPPDGLEILGSMLAGLDLSRPDDRTLIVRPEGGYLDYSIEQLTRASTLPFTVGETIHRKRMDAEILEILPDGRPAAVRFRFDVSLDDPSIRWFQAHGVSGAPWTPPRIGETTHLDPVTASMLGF